MCNEHTKGEYSKDAEKIADDFQENPQNNSGNLGILMLILALIIIVIGFFAFRTFSENSYKDSSVIKESPEQKMTNK